jgi:hypothetical protein
MMNSREDTLANYLKARKLKVVNDKPNEFGNILCEFTEEYKGQMGVQMYVDPINPFKGEREVKESLRGLVGDIGKHECEEDWDGYCYHCGRYMLDDAEVQHEQIKDSEVHS